MRQKVARHRYEDIDGDEEELDLDRFSSQKSLVSSSTRSRHVRNPSILSDDRGSCVTYRSENSLNSYLLRSSPRRGATVHDDLGTLPMKFKKLEFLLSTAFFLVIVFLNSVEHSLTNFK